MTRLEREIEAVLEARTGRECVFMPSGRFAIHLAFRLLLSPGDRILMSPLEDDTVFFGALAAGLRPVMAPVSTERREHSHGRRDGCHLGKHQRRPDRQHVRASRSRRRTQIAVCSARDSADRGCCPCDRDGGRRTPRRQLRCRLGLQPVEALSRARRRPLAGPRDQPPRTSPDCSASSWLRKPLSRRAVELARSAARTSLDALQSQTSGASRPAAQCSPVRPVAWRVPLRALQLKHALVGHRP